VARPESAVTAALAVLCLATVVAYAPGSAASTAGGTVAASATAPSRAGGQTSPNIVVIMADDMRTDDLRWLPSVRRLITERGVRFTNAFSPYPICCPARSSFLNGQYAHNHGVLGNESDFGFHSFDDSSTFATDLKRAGYRTVFLGKYLNGYGQVPPYGEQTGLSRRYVPPGWTDWRGGPTVKDGPNRGSVYNYFKTTLNVNGRLVPLGDRYQTNVFGSMSEDIVDRYAPSDTPFMLWASYVAPHFGSPRDPDDRAIVQNDRPRIRIPTPAVPQAMRGRFDEDIKRPRGVSEADVSDKAGLFEQMPMTEPGTDRYRATVESARQRAEALTVLDRQVERTVAALRQAGELDETLLVFTSDNGFFEGEHRIQSGKSLPYEPALSVPLLMRGPGIPAGQTRSDPVLTIDMAPTFNAIAGAETRSRTVDGQSILQVARQGDEGWTRPVVSETGPLSTLDRWTQDSVRDDPGKDFGDQRYFVRGLRTPRYLYIEWATGEVEMYDMRSDPGQLHSVHGQAAYADDQALLAAELERVKDCAGATCREPMPPGLTAPPLG